MDSKAKKSSISVVIPTRNRLESLKRLLASMEKQTLLPHKILIVDSSDSVLTKEQLSISVANIQILHSKPSVCRQRNMGIECCTTDYIFLCDDDIELSDNYCETLCAFLDANPNETIASGLVLEKDNGNWHYSEKQNSTLGLFAAYVFGWSVGFDANESKTNSLVNYYKNKGNSIAKSGWPIITNFGGAFFQAPIYGLGASIIRTEMLKGNRFDEAFYENGIGDNYDLAIGLNAPINVVRQAKAYHHREKTNRLQSEKAYYYRINALHYILLKHKRFGVRNLIYFVWSLFGKLLQFLCRAKFKSVYYNLETMLRILINKPLYKVKN